MTSRKGLSTTQVVLALGLLTAALACKKDQPAAPAPPPVESAPAAAVRVVEVQIGNQLGPDKKVKAPMTEFSTKDVIFASVVTDGTAASADLSARWTFQDGQVVNETKRAIAPTAAVTEFSIQKPDGWPAGNYQVHISLNGQPAETKSFKVQ